MNKIKLMIVLMLMLFVGGQMMGQTNGALYLGASFPMKDYAEFDDFGDFALMDDDADDAGAGIGFNAGLKWYFNMGVPGLGVMLSIDGLYNGPCSALKDAYRDNENQIGGQHLNGSFTYNSTPKFINVPVMVGLNYIYNFNSNLGLYLEAGAGGNARFITPMESLAKFTVFGAENKVVTRQSYDAAFSFAWQVGAGFEVAKNFRVGCSFYHLGNATVKGTETVKTTIGSNTDTSTDFNTFGTVKPVMVLARVGFSF